MEAARFDNLGVFTYSDEDTSASYALDGKVDGRTAQNRKRRLMAIQRKIARARNRALVGSEVSRAGGRAFARDRPAVAGAHAGAGARDRWRDPDQRFRGGPSRAPGEIRRLRITEAHDYDVVGRAASQRPPNPQPG